MATAFETALALDIPYKSNKLGCLPYAKALCTRLRDEGFQADVVTYHWRGTDGEAKGLEEDHAIVLYRDETQRLWGMDATSARPKWLPGDKDLATTAQWFAGDDMEVSNVQSVDPLS